MEPFYDRRFSKVLMYSFGLRNYADKPAPLADLRFERFDAEPYVQSTVGE